MTASGNYHEPSVTDFGTIADLTQALGVTGDEDGMSKLIPIHHVPVPSTPLIP